MAENLLTAVGGKPVGAGDGYHYGTEVIGLKLDILGKKVNFSIGVGKGQVRLSDIVPMARKICTEITNVVLQSTLNDGGHIPCRKGCAACCSHYLVPLSIPEAFLLKEEISAAPAHRRDSIRRACLLAASLILSQKPPKTFVHQTAEASSMSMTDLDIVSSWYKSLELNCPFLDSGICTIYEQRPLACREHCVEGSARACRGHHGTAAVLQMPVSVLNALGQLASEFEGTSVEAVLLPLSLVWCEENAARDERTWPSTTMVKRFVEIIKSMTCTNFKTSVV